MDSISVSEFKATCLALLEKVKRTGQPLLITKHGEPIAQVVPAPPAKGAVRQLGCLSETGRILGDIVSPAAAESDWEAAR